MAPMKLSTFVRIKLFIKTVANGILGIFSEIVAGLLFILLAYVICVAWWGILK